MSFSGVQRLAVLVVLAVCLQQAAAAREPKPTLYDAVKSLPSASRSFQEIVRVGLDQQFKNPRLAVTAFIPSDTAFERITKAIASNPVIMNDLKIIKTALAYHILNKPMLSTDFPVGSSTQLTALKAPVQVSVDPSTGLFKVGAFNIVEKDIPAGKSVIHIIDGFLVPPSLLPTIIQATRAAKAAAAVAAEVPKSS